MSVLFSAQTYPNKLPELLIKSELSRSPSNGRHAFFCVQFTPAQYLAEEVRPQLPRWFRGRLSFLGKERHTQAAALDYQW